MAGGAALNELLKSARVSRDVDLFHDTREAVLASWESDRKQLKKAGYEVRPLREFTSFVEAEVTLGQEGESRRDAPYLYGVPGRNRTCNLLIRSQMLCPIELQVHGLLGRAHTIRIPLFFATPYPFFLI